MEFYEEIFLTAVISILLAFLIGKIAGAGADEDEDPAAARAAASASVSSSAAAGGGEKAIELKDLGRPRVGLGSTTEKGPEEPETAPTLAGDESRTCEVEFVEGGLKVGETDKGEVGATVEEGVVLEADERRLQETPAKGTDKEVSIHAGDANVPDEEPGLIDDVVEGQRVVEEVVRGVEEEMGAVTSIWKEHAEEKDEKEGSLLHGEDEWEGIERSELEKLFAVASEFVISDKGAEAVTRLSNETQMQLYALHKCATEGPCYEPQPMALKVSSRAKWNAWQRLGNMNPEAAMEQYINLLTDNIPEWLGETSGGEAMQNDASGPPEVGVSATEACDSASSLEKNEAERLHGDLSCIKSNIEDVAAGPELFNQGLTKTFLFNLLSPTRVSLLIFYS